VRDDRLRLPDEKSFKVESFLPPGRWIEMTRVRELHIIVIIAKYMKHRGAKIRVIGPDGNPTDPRWLDAPLKDWEKELIGRNTRRIGP
jgi:hypothetical protein